MLDMQLTSRQKQIYRLVGAGLSNKQIAANLFMEEKAVKFHLTNIFKKAGVSSRTELCALFSAEERAKDHNSAARQLLTAKEAFDEMVAAAYKRKEAELDAKFSGHRTKEQVVAAFEAAKAEVKLHADSPIARQMLARMMLELGWNGQ